MDPMATYILDWAKHPDSQTARPDAVLKAKRVNRVNGVKGFLYFN